MAAPTSATIVILPASAEIFEGTLKPSQISQRINQELLIDVVEKLLCLIY
ncbi:hypothetical protein [Nostoc sp.]